MDVDGGWYGPGVLVALVIVVVAEAFAAGAVLASLATEVVPEAFADATHGAGPAITAGFIVTFLLAS